MNIYVGNLSPNVTEQELKQEFGVFGEVTAVVVMNKNHIRSGQALEYAYVEMASKTDGAAAISGLNGKALKSQPIHLVEALPLSDKRNAGNGIGTGISAGKRKREER